MNISIVPTIESPISGSDHANDRVGEPPHCIAPNGEHFTSN
ncbi:hypothetical protein [Mycolicibacterium sp. P1-5]|nr:hypothetical protein [Mycolicibacterium sp. P1-5]